MLFLLYLVLCVGRLSRVLRASPGTFLRNTSDVVLRMRCQVSNLGLPSIRLPSILLLWLAHITFLIVLFL